MHGVAAWPKGRGRKMAWQWLGPEPQAGVVVMVIVPCPGRADPVLRRTVLSIIPDLATSGPGLRQSVRRRNTRVALAPPKPKLLDMTVSRRALSTVSRTMGMPVAAGSSSAMLAEAVMKPCSIISSE